MNSALAIKVLFVTGAQNTQQHIYNKILEKTKELLTTTNLTVTEIVYELGI